MVEQEPIVLDKELGIPLEQFISKCDKYFDEDSPQHLLWELQRRRLDLKRK